MLLQLPIARWLLQSDGSHVDIRHCLDVVCRTVNCRPEQKVLLVASTDISDATSTAIAISVGTSAIVSVVTLPSEAHLGKEVKNTVTTSTSRSTRRPRMPFSSRA